MKNKKGICLLRFSEFPFRVNRSVIAVCGFIILSFSSCYYDSNEELYGDIPCKTGSISYAADVVPILSANCYNCHSISNSPVLGNGIVLENYSNLNDFLSANQATFVGAIEHSGGASAMPKNGAKMDKCSISALKDWITQGKLNN